MRGSIEGNHLIFESIGDSTAEIPLVWDAGEGSDLVWTNEASLAGGPWMLVETYHLTPD